MSGRIPWSLSVTGAGRGFSRCHGTRSRGHWPVKSRGRVRFQRTEEPSCPLTVATYGHSVVMSAAGAIAAVWPPQDRGGASRPFDGHGGSPKPWRHALATTRCPATRAPGCLPGNSKQDIVLQGRRKETAPQSKKRMAQPRAIELPEASPVDPRPRHTTHPLLQCRPRTRRTPC